MKNTKQMEQQKLSTKIAETFSRILSQVLLIVAFAAIVISGTLIIFYTSSMNRSDVTKYTMEIDETMQSKVSMLNTIAVSISSGTLNDIDDVATYVDTIVEMDDQISAVYSCYDENITIMSGGWQPPEDFIVMERSWYQNAQANPDEVYISDPYVDLQTGQICITLSKATYKDGKIAGVVGMDMYMNDLVSLIENSYAGNRYVFLTTADGVILVHPNSDYSLQDETGVTLQDANHGRYKGLLSGDMHIKTILDYKGGFKFAAANTSKVTGWKVISVEPLSNLLIFLIALVILYFVIYIVTQNLAQKKAIQNVATLFHPLESISQKVSRIADGDLNIAFDEEKNSTEIENLTDSLNETIVSLDTYIAKISDTVTAISDKDLSVSIDGNFKGSYIQIKEALEKILSSLNDSFRQIRDESDIVLEFSDKLEQTSETVAESATKQNEAVMSVASDVDQLTERTKMITDRAMSVKENADITNTHLNQSAEEMKALITAMEHIEKCSEEIADFVGEIASIATQTNLLSLNASIEAARAGEAGRGFAVVAGEISTLAASSAQASTNINKLIQESKNAVNNGKDLVTATAAMMEQGVRDSLVSEDSIDEIVSFVKNQQESIENIDAALKDIANMVEHNAASAQENTAISQQLNSCAQTLKDMADSFTLKF